MAGTFQHCAGAADAALGTSDESCVMMELTVDGVATPGDEICARLQSACESLDCHRTPGDKRRISPRLFLEVLDVIDSRRYTPRRAGKTMAVALFAAAYMHTQPGTDDSIFGGGGS